MGNAFSWMAWTLEVAVFFICVVLMLIVLLMCAIDVIGVRNLQTEPSKCVRVFLLMLCSGRDTLLKT